MNTAKNFVNFHVLISHSPSCLNRDDMNMQKTAIFGGVKRVRISSQSLKRAMRTSAYYAAHVGKPSMRTRELEMLIPVFVEQLKEEFDPAIVARTMELFVRAKATDDEPEEAEGDDSGPATENKKLAVAPWALEEIRVLCGIVGGVALTEEETEKAKANAAKQKGKKKKTEQDFIDDVLTKKRVKAVEANIKLVRKAIASAPDIALSGRMATSGLMTSIDGALALAHAITTHAVEPQDVDWFSAVDDLVVDAGGTGSGHLDTQEFSAGVFYRYASLNLKQLQVNLGLIDDIHSPESAESRAQALEIAKHLLHLLATVVPSAKRQPFAADNLAEFAIVSFSDVPVSLANAFEKPVKRANSGGGYLAPSQRLMAGYWEKLNRAYGLDEQAAAFRFDDAPWTEETKGANAISWPEKLATLDTLPALENWIAADGQA